MQGNTSSRWLHKQINELRARLGSALADLTAIRGESAVDNTRITDRLSRGVDNLSPEHNDRWPVGVKFAKSACEQMGNDYTYHLGRISPLVATLLPAIGGQNGKASS